MSKINHKLTAASRIVKNTIYDNTDQQCIDILLSKHGEDITEIKDPKERIWLEQQLMSQEGLYTDLDFLKINVCSWNLGGIKPLFKSFDMRKWLLPFDSS